MEIIDPELKHLHNYFKNYSGNLKPNPAIRKGLYYFDGEDIYYDPRLKYCLAEVQFLAITHAILHRKYAENRTKKLIEIYEQIDPAAIERAVRQFPERSRVFFTDILRLWLFKHPGSLDKIRMSNMKRYVPDYNLATY